LNFPCRFKFSKIIISRLVGEELDFQLKNEGRLQPVENTVSPSEVELLFAMTGARGLCGGIAGANLNVLPALIELAEERAATLTVLSFLERESDRPDFVPEGVSFKGVEGNKVRYVLDLLSAARRRAILCFDHVTLALPVLPLAAAGLAKTVIFAHGSESWRRLRRTSRWSFQCASLCLANSPVTLRKMRRRISNLNAAACPLGLPPDVALNSEIPAAGGGRIAMQAADGNTYRLGDQFFLLVARMHPGERKKGHYALIAVLPELLKCYHDVQLVFAGPGDDRVNLHKLAQSRGVASAVFLPGFLPMDLLQRLYQHCYAFVMPSQQEGFGLAYLEAMNYAKPCVGCFDQGAEDIIIDGETGFLVHHPDDRQELLGVLCALLRDADQARALGRNGFERLHQFFTSRHYQQRLKEQMTRLLSC
jgi:glycosyltransferase involved in cell wall biosynthesis